MQPDTSSDQPLSAPSAPAAPASPGRAQRPWHQPRLTQVALQVTGLGSGTTEDQDGSSTPPK